MGRPTYEAPTREYTHTHAQTQTNTQRGPTKYGADSRRGGALLISRRYLIYPFHACSVFTVNKELLYVPP